jgi:hypothetical protein
METIDHGAQRSAQSIHNRRAEVILTPNEVRHAKENKCIALFVLSNVKIERAEEGQLPPRAESATSTTRGI